jgi:predicted regulator of amino acid metabolism with ACT domain
LWSKISSKLQKYPSREKVVKLMVELGMSVDEKGRLSLGPVEVSHAKVAKAAGVDRRVVRETAKFLKDDSELAPIFKKIRPIGPSLAGIASIFGMGVLEVRADPTKPGTVTGVSGAISKAGINIRQIIADDPDLVPDPKLYVVTEKKVPGKVIEEILGLPFVASVSAM